MSEVNHTCVDRCPKCGSKEVQRSHRKNIFEFGLGFVFLPWRCTVCYVRFYRPSWMKAAPRQLNLAKQFGAAKTATATTQAARISLRSGKKTAPRVVEGNPMLGLIPARR